MVIGGALTWARVRGVFRASDVALLETIGIPPVLRQGAHRAYTLLEGGKSGPVPVR
jgi:hypothetical protein